MQLGLADMPCPAKRRVHSIILGALLNVHFHKNPYLMHTWGASNITIKPQYGTSILGSVQRKVSNFVQNENLVTGD